MTTDSDFSWLVKHAQELSEKYPGKWVAIWRRRVIAVADTAVEVATQADMIAPSQEYILHAINSDVDTIYACV